MVFEFQVAAKSQVADETELEEGEAPKPAVEFDILGQTFKADKPTPGRVNVLFSARGGVEGTREVWNFLRDVLWDDGYQRLRDLVANGEFPPQLLFGGDELNEEGVVDHIISATAGRPTQPSNGSSPSPSSTGVRSTGRSRSATSTPSS
jgi:hypothetical protein